MTTILDIEQSIDEINKNKKEIVKTYRKQLLLSMLSMKNNSGFQDALKEYKQAYLEEYSKYIEYFEFLKRYYYSTKSTELIKVLRTLQFDFHDAYTYYLLLSEFDSYINPNRVDIAHVDITQDQQLSDEIKGLTISQADIDKFFNYSEELFYAKEKTKFLNGNGDNSFYGVYLKTDDDYLRSMLVRVPKIINLETAKIMVNSYQHVHDLCPYIGEQLPTEPEKMNELFGKIRKRGEISVNRFVTRCVRNK